MKRPELVTNKPAEEDEEHEEPTSPFPVFDRLRRERIAEEAEKPPVKSTDDAIRAAP